MAVIDTIVNAWRDIRGLSPHPALVHVKRTFTVAEAEGTDAFLLYLFPSDCWLLRDRLRVVVGAFGASHVMSIGFGGSDGVLDTTLISASTAGAAGATDEIDTVALPIEVSDLYLIANFTTGAGTGAIKDLEVLFEIVIGHAILVRP